MHLFPLLLSALTFSTFTFASPTLQERAVSTDGTCGGTNGYTCPPARPCCSRFGHCGSGEGYCQTGCQSAFGVFHLSFHFPGRRGNSWGKKADEARHAIIHRHKQTCGFVARRIRVWSVRRINVARRTVCSLRSWEIEEEVNVRG